MSTTFFSGWAAINAFTPSPNPDVEAGSTYTADLSKFSATGTRINWDQDATVIPSQLFNADPLTVGNTVGYDIAYDTYILITGQKRRDCGSTPYTHIVMTDRNGITADFSVSANTQDTGASGTTFWTNGQPTLLVPGRPTTQAQWDQILNGAARVTTPYFRIPQGINFDIETTACHNYDAYNYTLTILLRIYVTTNCQGNNLQAPACTQFCAVALDTCFPRYMQYCFNPNTNIGNIPACREFFSTYIPVNGSPTVLDDQLITYCRKYRGFADLFDVDSTVGTPVQRAIDLDLCSCHLSSHDVPDPNARVLYENFEASLAKDVPYFKFLGFTAQCLVPQCASASFKPNIVPPTGCALPQCLNIASVNNNGTINGNVTIDQSNACGGGHPDNSYTWGYLLAVAIVIIIVILAILYLFGYIK